MKQNWVRLWQIVRNTRGQVSTRQSAEAELNGLFLRHHKNADEIVCGRTGVPLCAVYFTPSGKNQEEFKNLMRVVRERVQYAFEMEE